MFTLFTLITLDWLKFLRFESSTHALSDYHALRRLVGIDQFRNQRDAVSREFPPPDRNAVEFMKQFFQHLPESLEDRRSVLRQCKDRAKQLRTGSEWSNDWY